MTKCEAYENLKDYLDNVFHNSNDYETYCYLRDCADTLAPPTPDPDTGPEGCWHCRNIEAHRIEYVIAVRTKGGTLMNTPGDCPYHYCPACGRKLGVEG